jgi:hypothetical protein
MKEKKKKEKKDAKVEKEESATGIEVPQPDANGTADNVGCLWLHILTSRTSSTQKTGRLVLRAKSIITHLPQKCQRIMY